MVKEPTRMLHRREVMELLGVSQSCLYTMVNSGTFPKPKRISVNRVAWPMSAIAEWQESLPDSEIAGGPRRAGVAV